MTSVFDAALRVLSTADAGEKSAVGLEVAKAWGAGDLSLSPGSLSLPDRPARPENPPLLPPNEMPRRRLGSQEGRIALLHSLAHIELNAIDLAFDMIARFAGCCQDMSGELADFVSDWIQVGREECNHFNLLTERLHALDSSYGALPAHDGLWEAAYATRHDWLARLAVVPLVLEARGLDVSPQTIDKLAETGDQASAEVLSLIYEEEIGHVAIGTKWFLLGCKAQKTAPDETFHLLVARHFKGALKPPFNHEARNKAGLLPNFYTPLAR
ncbi:MAG: ferritin-like domain-containing protein [Alphaproteobacteria bacterium]|nr:MAG: ferritin-like domain-containing protein [Alphaproteobacteria bacterium]